MIAQTSDTTALAVFWIPVVLGGVVMVGNAIWRAYRDKGDD